MAGKPKNPQNAWLPKHVTQDKHGYRYRNRATKESARLKDAQGNTLKPGAPKSEVYAAYERLTKEHAFLLKHVIERYYASPTFLSLGKQTQHNYREYHGKRLLETFGNMVPETITAAHVRLYMDARSQKPNAANSEKALLSVVFNWGLERALINPTTPNPCLHVKKLKIQKKNRYFSDQDYYAFFNYLLANNHIAHAAAMAIAYNCAARQQDVLRLQEHKPFNPSEQDCYLTKEHIRIYQAKTGTMQNKRYNSELKHAIQLAKQHKRQCEAKGKITNNELIISSTGQKYTRYGFNGTWQRRQKTAHEQGIITERFRFHDLKHKAISDHQGDKQTFSGHSTEQMAKHYDHSIATVDSLKKKMTEKDKKKESN